MKAIFKASLAVAVVWLVYFLKGNVYFRLYPAVVCALAFSAFAFSSLKTPLVEKIARRSGEKLDANAIAYCRKVNNCWIVFLSLHLCVTIATVFASMEVWAFYNGFLAYVLMALMFAAERFWRMKVKGGGR